MFERFTEPARRVIFFAFYEAVQARHKEIQTIDLLRGLTHEWPLLRKSLKLRIHALEEDGTTRPGSSRLPRGKVFPKKASQAREKPFSESCKKALRYTMQFAEQAGNPRVTRRHLLLGVARQDAAIRWLLSRRKVNPADLPLPEDEQQQAEPVGGTRVGIGYDYHRLVEGRKLVLGGVEIPFRKGLAGHSDGDVLTHAICDALLGAAALGDLGQHFPDTDSRWKRVNSLELLARVVELVGEKGLRVAQVDSVVVAQEPKLAPYFSAMRERLARTLGLESAQVNVKAKTTEGLEAVGRGEAMAAQAIVLLVSR